MTLPQLTVLFFLAGGAWTLVRFGRTTALERIVSVAMTTALIPTAAFLLICAFQPERILKLSDPGVYLGAASLNLFYVAFRALAKGDG